MITALESVASNRKDVRRIRMEIGAEFICRYLQDWFTESAIMYEYSLPNSPVSNRMCKRLNRTILGNQ